MTPPEGLEPGALVWQPSEEDRAASRMARFLTELNHGVPFATYEDAWRHSVDHLGEFWRSLWEYFGVRSSDGFSDVLVGDDVASTKWFPGAMINYAEHAFGDRGNEPRLLAYSQTREPMTVSGAELADAVGRARRGLLNLGVRAGDRVAGYLPNVPEAVVAFLATASLGAVWSSAPPEFGRRSVIDRFGQIAPKVLLAGDGYRYGTQPIDRLDDVAAIADSIPSIERTVAIPYLHPGPPGHREGFSTWDELLAEPGPLEFEPVPFDHPLFILYSSGTTGLPKPIVHGHGGILLEHLKMLALHMDLSPRDRFFWFSTTGWVMWNILVSGLLTGSSIVLFDGNPLHPTPDELWRIAADAGVTCFGVSPLFLMKCREEQLTPGTTFDLSRVRAVGSTGAPLPPEAFAWVASAVKAGIPVWSMSGGTDVATAFLGGAPLVPVWNGELSCKYLACRVEAFDESGASIVGTQGELVVTAPMPSMPVMFWGDDDGKRLRAAYFERYPGVWHHGDWVELTDHGSAIITGRSDATLNRGGVRLGTSEFYGVVEEIDGVLDSLVVHQDRPESVAGRLVLFVVLADGRSLDELRPTIVSAIRDQLSPRHVPDEVHEVPAIPRTLTGKKLEVPVKRILSGLPVEESASMGALANPESLSVFTRFALD